MQRASSIEALLKRATADAKTLKDAYEASLHAKQVSGELKVQIKTIFENLRSCFDYMAQDIFDSKCAGSKKPNRLYFPIRHTPTDFHQAIAGDFPGLAASAPAVLAAIEAIQPYSDPWLGQFNKLNNHNKHQDLVEQTRTEARYVTVSNGGGSVTWGPGVRFGAGVKVVGAPIDPRTQMPIPTSQVKTEVVVWVDFHFTEINESVLPFVNASVKKTTTLFETLKQLV
jgi:hypothetical protein